MRYLEDLAVGATFRTGTVMITEQDIIAFAQQFDPQPFHLDSTQAQVSVFGALVASGWHTVGVTMRLLVEGDLQLAGGLVGLGIDSIQWPRPVYPGDEISATTEILAIRSSRSRPNFGIVSVRSITYNQRGEEVQIMISNQLVPRRDTGEILADRKGQV